MKNIKLIIPAAVITCFALTSCNGSAGRLNRETYGTKVDTLTNLTETLEAIKAAQVESANGKDKFKLTKGTMNVKFDLALSGSFYFFQGNDERSTTINLNNISFVLSDTIEVKWDMEHDYLGVANKNGESLFVKKVDDTWGTYYTKEIGGKKYYRPIDNAWFDDDHFGSVENYLMYVMAENTGLFQRDDDIEFDNESIDIRGLGFDITGFGWDVPDLIKPDENDEIEFIFTKANYLAPGVLTDNNLDIMVGRDESREPIYEPIKTIIDEAVAYQAEHSSNIPLKVAYTKKDDNTGATINLGLNKVDLSKSKEIVKELGEIFEDEYLEKLIQTSGSGSIAGDYFVNFKDNFIHQQELVVDVDKANLQVLVPQDDMYVYINIKDANIHGYVNQNVELGKCDYKEPDTTGYTKLSPINPDPEEY